ncbi:cupin domain-containing protein [Streptomyces lavendulocolor]|uniref:cupin domain-containing protein n=1 Tax=Streptomyces lavendulocolor TaxID=67316 RepID=UPI0033CE9F6B
MKPTTNQSNGPLLVRAENAESLQDGATSLITLLADAGATGGALTANKATLHKGSPGAPAHFHTKATEMFFVLDGAMRILVNDEVLTLGKGDFLTVPAGRPGAALVSRPIVRALSGPRGGHSARP